MNTYIYPLSILLMLLVTLGSCKKEDPADAMELVIDLPVANIGDQVQFTVKNPVDNYTGFRFDPGDGSGAFSSTVPTVVYAYSNPGSYTVSTTVFYDNESTQLTAPITVEDPLSAPSDTNSNTNNGPGIRIKGIEVVYLDSDQADSDKYNNSDIQRYSDVYFTVKLSYATFDDGGPNTSIIYPKSPVIFDSDTWAWNLGTEIPIIYYNNITKMEIKFYDDDSREQSGDQNIGYITVYDREIQAYESSKPTTIQLSFSTFLTINVTLEWVN